MLSWLAYNRDSYTCQSLARARSTAGCEDSASTSARPSFPANVICCAFLVPIRSATIKANTVGRVVKIYVKRGDRVTAGEPLVDLDDRITKAELEFARARLGSAETRYRYLLSVPKSKSDASDIKIKQGLAEASLRGAESEFRAAEHRHADTKIKAPFDGTIMEIFVENDAKVGFSDPRKSRILDLADLSGFLAEATADESVWRYVHQGLPAEVRLPSQPTALIAAEVIEVDSQINSADGTFRFRVKLGKSNNVELLMSGMYVQVCMNLQ